MAGKNQNDRELASKVRSLALNEIKAIFEYVPINELKDTTADNYSVERQNKEMAEMKKQLLLRMSTTLLPRLNELSGPDGGEIPLPIYGGLSKYNSDSKDIQTKEKD